MNGDVRADGTPRSVSVRTASGDTITDSNDLAGYAYQSDTYSASGGTLQQVLVHHPWRSAATATHTRAGLPALVARLHGTDRTDTRQRLASRSWRVARVATSYDTSTGLPVTVDDLGQIDAAGQPVGGSTPERCTTTSYAADTARNMLAYPSQVITNQGACGSTASSRTLSATRTYYDGSTTLGQLAGPGDATASQALQDASPVSWQPKATATYDAYGRPTSATDPLGRSSSTSYGTTATTRKYLPVHLVTTNAKNWTTSTTLDPARGLPTSITDPNGRITSESYDGLGRLTKVWLPSHPKSSYATTPSRTYSYRVNRSTYVAVTSKSLLDSGYATSITIYDSLLQPRQVQSDPANDAAASRMVTDTRYDSHGRSVATDQAFFNDASAPATTPVTVATAAPAQTRTSYDGRGRVTRAALYSGGTFEWATTTAYPGADQTAVTPPAGGTPTRAILDARGQRTQLRQYHGAGPSGTYDVTYYGYDAAGRMTSMTGPLAQGTDPSGAPGTWSWSFDAAGNQVSASDPDSGTTTRVYDADGELTSTTDAGGQQLTTSYDVLGRKTVVRDGGSSGTRIASWSYDTAGAKGQLASATRYAGDGTTPTYTRTIAGYTTDYQPTGITETVPAGAYGNTAALTRTTTDYYTSVLGNLYMPQIGLSGTGGLAGSETLFRAYSGMGLPVTLGGEDSYVSWTNYDPHGRVVRATSAAMPEGL